MPRAIFLLTLTGLICGAAQAATITVNSTDNLADADDGLCTLHEAIASANGNSISGGSAGECHAGEAHPVVDEIVFDASILPAHFFPITAYPLNESMAIRGVNSDLVTITGIGFGRAMVVQNGVANAVFEVSDVTFFDNSTQPSQSDYGGAMLVMLSANSSLTLERVKFIDNHTDFGGGALGIYGNAGGQTTIRDSLFQDNYVQNTQTATESGGGAIFIGANEQVTIENSTFVGNLVFNLPLAQPQSDMAGGAILMRSSNLLPASTLTISQSTFSNNSAVGVGGAIALGGPGFPSEHGELILKHSTLTLNTADSNDDQTTLNGGGSVWSASSTPMSVFNTISALNTDNSDISAPDISGQATTYGYNLIGNNSGNTTTFPAGQPNANDDWVGVHFAEIHPQLDVLADNGGYTPTHLPLAGSFAIDKGKCNALTVDQRGFFDELSGLRAVDDPSVSNALSGCDIGAVEVQATSSNTPPEAIDDDYPMLEDAIPSIKPAAYGLLANDSDIDGDTLFVSTYGSSSHVTSTGWNANLTVRTDGAFILDVPADANGLLTLPYTVSDGLNASNATITISITPVNDAPSFTPGSTTLWVTAGSTLTVPSWADSMSAGPSDEVGQALGFDVGMATAGCFASLPTVDTGTGDLSITLTGGANGICSFDVALMDSGGTANGGVDTSATTTVEVHVGTQPTGPIFSNGFE
ncbi:MAG: choice-of-anchor Q domain-containing protein [Lysobacteraceae bacterium]